MEYMLPRSLDRTSKSQREDATTRRGCRSSRYVLVLAGRGAFNRLSSPRRQYLARSYTCNRRAQCTTIKGHPLRLVRISIVSASGKPSPSHSPLFFATSSVISHLTPPLSSCAGSRASPEPRAPPQPEGPAPSSLLSSNADDHVGELRLSVVCPPHFDSALGTVSGRCVEVHECFPWTSSHGSSSHRPSLAVPRRAESAVWTSTWSVYGLRFRPRRARWHPIARVVSCVQLGHQAATGEPS
jgi:hypothetical protein